MRPRSTTTTDEQSEERLAVPLTALRPALEALLMVADQPMETVALATAVGYPVDEVDRGADGARAGVRRAGPRLRAAQRRRWLALLHARRVRRGRGGLRPRRPAGAAHPGGARDARRGRLQAAGLAGPGLGDPRRQRRRRDAHAAQPRPGRGGRAGPRDPGATSTGPPATSWSGSACTSLDDLPELAPYLPDMADLEDELAEMVAPGPDGQRARPRGRPDTHPSPHSGDGTEPDGGTEPT